MCCDKCKVTWEYENEFNVHKDQKNKFKCKICKSKFLKESSLKYNSRVWCCSKCDLKIEYEYEFANHIEEDHDPPYPPHDVEANDSKHEKHVDEASADEEQTDDVTLFKKPLVPTRQKKKSELIQCSIRQTI